MVSQDINGFVFYVLCFYQATFLDLGVYDQCYKTHLLDTRKLELREKYSNPSPILNESRSQK